MYTRCVRLLKTRLGAVELDFVVNFLEGSDW